MVVRENRIVEQSIPGFHNLSSVEIPNAKAVAVGQIGQEESCTSLWIQLPTVRLGDLVPYQTTKRM
jgi:hypothetical protein